MDTTAAATLFAWLDREVWLVTARDGSRRGGLIATSVNLASAIPDLARMSVHLSKQHFTWELIQASGAFALHLLAEEHLDLVWRFGLESGRCADKFAGMDLTTGPSGSPLLPHTIGWLDCKVETRLDTGDRTLFIGELLQGQVTRFAPPLTARRLMELAPSGQLARLQRQRHLEGFRDAQTLALWRESQRDKAEDK